MLDAEFFKSFRFNLFQSRRNYSRQIDCCPFHFIRRVQSGRVKILSEQCDLQLNEGDIFFIPKGLQYRVYWSSENSKIAFSSFGFTFIPLATQANLRLQKLNCTPEELSLFLEIEQNMEVNPSSIGCLYRFLGAVLPKMDVDLNSRSDLIVNRALVYMQANTTYTVTDVARHCGVSECTLFLKFRNQLNQTPVEVRHQILCDKAITLLTTTDLSIEEISRRLRFSSSSYFRKILKKTTGQTPTQIRNRQWQFS